MQPWTKPVSQSPVDRARDLARLLRRVALAALSFHARRVEVLAVVNKHKAVQVSLNGNTQGRNLVMTKNPSTSQLVAYLVPKQLPVILARVMGVPSPAVSCSV